MFVFVVVEEYECYWTNLRPGTKPELPGLDDFRGEIMHSGAYLDGHKRAGKKAVVL